MAQFALLVWPLVAILLYRKLSLPWALSATIIGGYLLLPQQGGWDFPVLPELDKHSIPALSALVLTVITLRGRLEDGVHPKGWVPRHPVILALAVVLVLSGIATVQMNTDRLVYGPTVVSGLRMYDGLSVAQNTLLTLVPFLLARRVFASADNQRILLMAVAGAGALYAFLALYEIRMSPQLSNMVYGFFPHSWMQHVRSGGFRPLVFLNHGLLLAIFFCVALLAAFGLWRVGPARERMKFLAIGLWILLTLALSNSLGALMIALALLPIVLFVPSRMQILLAAGIGVLVLTYPMLRYGDHVPTERILSFAQIINAKRASSLEFRFRNEDILVAKAKERPLFGWGGHGRSRVYHEEGGWDMATTDGRWVIVFGVGGWTRYISDFGLLTAAILILALRSRRYELDPVTALLALVLAANLIDMLPNSATSPVTWLMAGALAGRLELGRSTVSDMAAGAIGAQGPPRRAGLAYSRSGISSDDLSQPSTHSAEEPDRDRSGSRFSRFAPRPGRSA